MLKLKHQIIYLFSLEQHIRKEIRKIIECQIKNSSRIWTSANRNNNYFDSGIFMKKPNNVY